MSASVAPIALFVYNRPLHVRQTVEALRRNHLAKASDLFVFSDGAKDDRSAELVAEVRDFLKTVDGFRSINIAESATNLGLANSIICGVTKMSAEFGRVIVLEDDLVTSPWFLDYMNKALSIYMNDERVASIHGYSYPTKMSLPETFFLRGADCWGWATWDRAWKWFEPDGAKLLAQIKAQELERAFDLDGAYGFTDMLRAQIAGKNSSWAIRWHAACFLKNKLTLYPGHSLVHNIGNDGTGTHAERSMRFYSDLAESPISVEEIERVPYEVARLAFAEFMSSNIGGGFRRILGRIGHRIGLGK